MRLKMTNHCFYIKPLITQETMPLFSIELVTQSLVNWRSCSSSGFQSSSFQLKSFKRCFIFFLCTLCMGLRKHFLLFILFISIVCLISRLFPHRFLWNLYLCIHLASALPLYECAYVTSLLSARKHITNNLRFVQKLWKPYIFLLIPTIKYYRY